VYDAFGNRVRHVVNGQTYDLLYDLSGRTVDGLTNGTITRSEAYAGNSHIATYANNTTQFDQHDWLGTFRAGTNVPASGGSPVDVETCTSMPFGEDFTCTVGDTAEASPIHFTGQERDWESVSEHFPFRYYNEVMGRWLTPDPAGLAAADPTNPQTWNRYAYVMNNPLAMIDPSGLGVCQAGKPCLYVPAPTSVGGPGGPDEFELMGIPVVVQNPDGTWPLIQMSNGQLQQYVPYGYSTSPDGFTIYSGNGTWVNVSGGYVPFSLYPPSMFTPAATGTTGVTATIKAGPPNAKQDFCQHQANLAAAEAVLPGLANAIQGDYRPIAASATSEAVQDYALDAAASSTSFLATVRSWTGIPMSVTSKALSIVGYVGTAYTAYSALKAAQGEYAACMQ
jgi:RHS repeat-associated protein